jgi:uncharacterized AAA domain-containing protein ycf46
MELFETQKGKVLEQLKEAVLTHTPIAYIPTNDLDFINELILSEETHGALIPRIKYNVDGLVCLEHNQFFETAPASGKEAYITDNYIVFPSSNFSPDNIKLPSLIVLSIANWDEAKFLHSFIRKYHGIKNEKTYLKPEDIDKFYRSLCIITSPTNLPIPAEYAPYVKRIDIPVLSDDEIRATIKESLEQFGYEMSLFTDDFQNQLVVSLRGFSKSKVRHMFAGMMAKQYFSQANADEKGILSIIRMEKKALMEDTPGLKWENVGNIKAAGLGSMEAWIKDRQEIFSDPKKALEKNIDIPNGVLISGIPGSGKSLMAKTAASLLKLPLISLDMGDLLGGIMGQSEHNMINALHMAEQMAPCVLWIDEIEKAFSGSSQNSTGDSGVGRRMFGKFLTWMQEKSSACFVFATSNDITALPPELFRSERFDSKFFTFMPTVDECAEIFASIIKKENETYRSRLLNMSPSKVAEHPPLLFSIDVEDPKFWINILNDYCAPSDSCITLQRESANCSEVSKDNREIYIWKDRIKPNFKLLTGADISSLIKQMKFRLYKGTESSHFDLDPESAHVYSSMVIYNTVSDILRSPDYKPYGETNVLDIVKCFYRLYINQFVPASGKCILDFSRYSDDEDCYYHIAGDEFPQRYDKALYYLLAGAINKYGPKIKIKS